MESESDHEQPIANSSSASSTTTSSSGGGSSNNSSNSNLLVNLPMMPSLFDDGRPSYDGHGHEDGHNDDEDDDDDDDESVQLLRRHSLPETPPMLVALEAVMARPPEPNMEQALPRASPPIFVAPSALLLNNNNAVATSASQQQQQSSSLSLAMPSSSTSPSSSSSSSSTPSSHNQALPQTPPPPTQLQQPEYVTPQRNTASPPPPPTPVVQPNPQPSPTNPQHVQETHHQHSPSPSSIQQQPQQQSLHHPSPSPSTINNAEQLEDDDDVVDADVETDNFNNPPANDAIATAIFTSQGGAAAGGSTVGQQIESLNAADASSSRAAAAHIATPPSALPYGRNTEDSKETTPSSPPRVSHYASHYSHYTHPSPEFTISHAHHNHNPCFGIGPSDRSGGYDNYNSNNTTTTMDPCSTVQAMLDAALGGAEGGGYAKNGHQKPVMDRIKLLYPNVDETETPLPRCWSPHDKCLTIGLSNSNFRVQYKGVGKQHNDAAAVRTAYPIPPACGLYYFEVKIISKGKNGYMGIGLTAQQFRMNHLPGWDKHSYGYHGDDGKSFSSSGNGQSYGPTFTTGDVIGCCVNFVTNTCFYTKNGIDLGIAFRDLPSNTKLYPTVGLQTPGEEVETNFGQEPFKFDQIEDMMQQMRMETKAAIYDFPLPLEQGDPTSLLHKMVSSYLVHNGYSETAEAFARATSQTFPEDIQSVRNRQKILKLIMNGRIGQAIEHTSRSYPGLLENNSSLMFMLKCRQFIEMINGSDLECYPANYKLTQSSTTTSTTTHTQTMPNPNQTSVIQSTKTYQNGKTPTPTNADVTTQTTTQTTTATVITADDHDEHQQDLKKSKTIKDNEYDDMPKNDPLDRYINDVEMENNGNGFAANGSSCKNGNGNFNKSLDIDEEMDIDVSPSTSSKHAADIDRILQFGRDLSQMGQQLDKDNNLNDEDKRMLLDAFSLIAYSNPWSSPLGWQLCPTKREYICTVLNSAILESLNFPRRPPLDYCVAHASELLKKMGQSSLGVCAFINVDDVFPQN